jgi:quercetin dioxygenase-like cupin family protein
MKLLWTLLTTCTIAVIPAFLVFSQDRPPDMSSDQVVVTRLLSTLKTSAGDPIRLPQGDAQMVVSNFDVPAGAILPVHRHPFPRYGYVLQGELQVTNVETGHVDVFKTGDFILEAVNHWHTGTNIGSTPLRLLVIDLIEAGANNTIIKD